MRTSRRMLVKALAGAGAAAVAGAPAVTRLMAAWAAQSPTPHTRKPRRWVMVIDLAACDGCKKCTGACQTEHFVPFGQEWIKVLEMSNNEYEHYKLPRPCMQCENAPCIKVCPVGATYHNPDGVVLINHDVCIGCRFCMAACPYGARSFNWTEPPRSPREQFIQYSPEYPVPHRKGTVEKCMFCAHRVTMGRLPTCVEECAAKEMWAIYFGDANENLVTNGQEVVRLSELLARGRGFRYKEELGTHPRVYYLLPKRGAAKAQPSLEG